ncbi:GntR family transcriptional regulator [Prauserella muralis]|uniref:GntR family transcriptional regulator n=1 Tax=Prauserella muralis TaxID=588067 RepID=UPI000DD38907|nr:GntR family transcriptional regulator [Prauserella muralis]TWE27566.1 regulatory GntR family protein [Prauserella muralis]
MPARRLTAAELVVLLGRWWTGDDRTGAVNLAKRIEYLVWHGQLGVGVELPSHRDLARELGRNRKLVAAAYGRLHERGIVFTNRTGGSWVLHRAPSELTTGSRNRSVS